MTVRSALLHDGAHYSVCWVPGTHGGLCVTRKRKRGGVIFPDTDGTWRDAFATALDDAERNDICRAILTEK